MKISTIVVLAIVACLSTHAQIYDTNNVAVQTFVGSGFYGYYDGQGVLTMFNNPSAVAADSSGNLFVFDGGNSRIRKVTPAGVVTSFVGGGSGSLPGIGTNVALPVYSYGSSAMTADRLNNLWLIAGSQLLIRVGADGYVAAYSLPAEYSYPNGICADSSNRIYFSVANKIIRFHPQTGGTETFVGSGNQGAVDGNWIFTSFNSPTALAADAADNIYVWDSGNHLIRRINQSRDVETIAGTNAGYYVQDVDGPASIAGFYNVNAMTVDGAGNLYLAGGTSIRRLSVSTNATTVAGSFSQSGYTNGPGTLARFDNVRGICLSQGALYAADATEHRIRKIVFNAQPEESTPAQLDLKLVPSLSITGIVGRTYRIESSLNLSNWTAAATILLTKSPYAWFDEGAAGPKKFYRTFLLP